jgi:hypothetical protein
MREQAGGRGRRKRRRRRGEATHFLNSSEKGSSLRKIQG